MAKGHLSEDTIKFIVTKDIFYGKRASFRRHYQFHCYSRIRPTATGDSQVHYDRDLSPVMDGQRSEILLR